MINWQDSFISLPGIGPALVVRLNNLGLQTLSDLLTFYPRRYDDFSHPQAINQLMAGHRQIIGGQITHIANRFSPRQRLRLTEATIADSTGQIEVIWFNQPFLTQQLRVGSRWLFGGAVERTTTGRLVMKAPTVERQPRLVPIYPETAGLSSKQIRKLFTQIRPLIESLTDWLPRSVRTSQPLLALSQAYLYLHWPESIEQISRAKRRLAFNELLTLMLGLGLSRQRLKDQSAPVCKLGASDLEHLISQLPFALTPSQLGALDEIIRDLAQAQPMNRLLEGDVGSGKTVVGILATVAVVRSGYRGVWLAPTEILAHQHYLTASRLLADKELSVGLLTAQTAQKERLRVMDSQLIIATQAVLYEKIKIERLGLIIVDEQHRFGVEQRRQLIYRSQALTPHLLAMTATPIPRSLALTVYGDLQLSTLSTRPLGRLPVITRLVKPRDRVQAYQLIEQELAAGHQAFVVCPLIEKGSITPNGRLALDYDDRLAAIVEYNRLRKEIFPNRRIGLLHGQLKSTDKAAVMENFTKGRIDLLICTSVIEVGIDIPNATVMMIEGAERFGLAQLHQLRGRVGRGQLQSYCLVFTEANDPHIFARLKAFTRTTSGFELAELDLKLRGPGQLIGLAQSGLQNLKIASLSDISLIREVKSVTDQLLIEGLEDYPELNNVINKAVDHLN